mmetsp:Transcript_16393/g.34722  ORF Transcript_16393/g.34722 Transcript_16393/m.34722 type:complete len:92 (-) Transcript_16393:257-532(-)
MLDNLRAMGAFCSPTCQESLHWSRYPLLTVLLKKMKTWKTSRKHLLRTSRKHRRNNSGLAFFTDRIAVSIDSNQSDLNTKLFGDNADIHSK